MDFFQQIDNIALLEPAAHFELFRSISNALNSKYSGSWKKPPNKGY